MLPFERVEKVNTVGNLWLYILTLAKKRPIYGYELLEKIKEKFHFRPSRFTCYRVLYRLLKNGYLTKRKGKKRVFYEITEKGEKELKRAKEFYKKLSEIL